MPFTDEKTIKQNIKNKSLSGAYLFCGNQPYSVLKYASAFINSAVTEQNDFNLVRFDGENFDIVSFEEAVNSAPFFTDRKCVVLNEPDDSKMDKETLNSFCKILKNVPETTVVLIYITGYEIDSKDKRNTHNKFAAALSKAGVTVCEFTRKSLPETAAFIQEEFKKQGKSVSRENAMYLAEVTLSNEGIIENEIDKLCSYSKETEITSVIINLLVPKNLSVSIFDLTNAIIVKDIKKALYILNELLNEKVEAASILAVLSNGFLDYYRAKIAISNGVSIDKTADDFAYFNRKFVLEKATRIIGRKDIRYFRQCIKLLEKASLDFFTITLDEKPYLETLIVKLALVG